VDGLTTGLTTTAKLSLRKRQTVIGRTTKNRTFANVVRGLRDLPDGASLAPELVASNPHVSDDMRRPSLLLCLVVFLLAASARMLSVQTIISPVRSINWSAGVRGGISTSTTNCATLNPGATAAQINSAIAGCPSGQVVKLNAGTYTLTTGLTISGKSNVTLRGAGPDLTFLVFTGATGCMVGTTDICISDGVGLYPPNPGHSANWTAGYAKGTTSITLSSTTGLAVGDILVLDQLDDSNTDTGNIWICSTMDVCSSEGDSNIRRANRSQNQLVVVTAISGSTVTFDPPAGLYMPNWTAAKSPGAWWGSQDSVHHVGIEDLSLNHTSSLQQSGIFVTGARDWWVKNIRSINSDRAAVWVYGATRGTIRDSYFFGTQHSESQSYGIETDVSSDILVENNIFQHMALGAPTGESVTGGVYGYNYGIDDYYVSGGNTGWMQAGLYHHSAGISFHLFEGNDGPGFTADQIHGTSNFATLFRNYLVGFEQGKFQQTVPMHIYSFNRYFNVIGNVLGLAGYHDNYEGGPASPTTSGPDVNSNASIFMLGWSGNQAKYPTMPNDLLVRSTLMRWGNYDTVTGTARFVASEVPSGLSLYANSVPANNVLPASMYLSSKPLWWGPTPWPAIGPDVTGGSVPGVGGHAYKIPARLCFENIMGGTFGSGVLTFNASRCYAPSGAPASPRNLRIVP
jgi:hypothetical protein